MTLSTLFGLLLCGIAQTPDSQAVAIYASILGGLSGAESDTLLLVDSSYVSTLRPGGVTPLPRAFPLRRSIRFVTRAELTDSLWLGRRSADPEGYWTRFRRRFPGIKGWYALSPITFIQTLNDGKTARVTYEWHCGPLCGEGRTITLTYDGARWHVAESRPMWVN